MWHMGMAVRLLKVYYDNDYLQYKPWDIILHFKNKYNHVIKIKNIHKTSIIKLCLKLNIYMKTSIDYLIYLHFLNCI